MAITVNNNEKLWVEKYRPSTIDQCIIPDRIKKTFEGFISKKDLPNLILCGSAGTGKAQPLTSKILTNRGYITFNDVQLGDVVLDGTGKTTTVTGVYPQGKRKNYRITFNDNTSIEVSDNHLNVVYNIDNNNNRTDLVIETEELLDNIKANHNQLYYVDIPVITHLGIDKDDLSLADKLSIINKQLDDIDNQVEIDQRCVYTDYHSRLAVVQTIIDRFGNISNRNDNPTICNLKVSFKNQTFSNSFATLVRTLGVVDVQSFYYRSINKASTKIYTHDLRCDPSVCLFTCDRLYNKIQCRVMPKMERYITNIESIGEVECKCIMVESHYHTYITDNVTPTHNTTIARALTNELDCETLFINASLENGIDVLRNKITAFASSISLTGQQKVVILDEGDYLNCLDEDEYIKLADQSEIQLKSMEDEVKYNVKSLNMTTGQFEDDIAEVVNRTEKEVFEIELEDGKVLRCTEDHPLIVKDKNGNIFTRTIKDGLGDVELVLG